LNLIQKGHRHTHRGIIGIESAIVLIAFVIVAAALAFVVLNMGFSTTQKAKTAIIAALEEAGSSLEVAGKITGVADISENVLNATSIPVKIVSGGGNANLDGNFTSIKVITTEVDYDNVYEFGPLFVGTYQNASNAWEQAMRNGWLCGAGPWPGPPSCNPYNGTLALPKTIAIIYFSANQNDNSILDIGEHIQVAVAFAENERPESLDYFAVEVSTPKGAPMTVDRYVPNITTEIVDLG
jgi:archaeal flagellin FlaB